MSPSDTKIHIHIGFHRILPYMQFCLHGLSPVLDRSHDLAQTSAQYLTRKARTQPKPAWGSPKTAQAWVTRPLGRAPRESYLE